MKTPFKLVTCGTSALFAAVLCLQAQSTTPTTPPPSKSDDMTVRYSSDQSQKSQQDTLTSPSDPKSGPQATTPDSSLSAAERSANSSSMSASGQLNTQSSLTTSTETDTQVTTIVQQIDAQGPVVVERVSTQFADIACSEANARALVEALHAGTSVTLTGEDGQTVSFQPTGQLGYGEAYIAMALAAETLRQNGITGCATPEQWRSVLIGGPLAVSGTTTTTATASSSSDFPGILVLRTQGQGWGQIAQTSNIQLGQVVSRANTTMNLRTDSSSLASPTGEMDATKSSTDSSHMDKKEKKDWKKDNKSDGTVGSSTTESRQTIGTNPRNPNAYEKSENKDDKSLNASDKSAQYRSDSERWEKDKKKKEDEDKYRPKG